MKILVTGATGFLGSHLVETLLEQGHHVGCVVREGSIVPAAQENCQVWTVAQDGEGLHHAVRTYQPDVVAHLAALYVCEHEPEDIRPLLTTNVAFGVQLLDAMQRAGCTALVYTGSAFQHYHGREYCPVNLYAATKQAFSTIAEYFLDAGGLRLLELHLYDSYGPNDSRPKLLNRLIAAAEMGTEMAMSDGTQQMHVVHVDDLSRGVAMACEQVPEFNPGERRVYRLPSEKAVTLRELVATLGTVAHSHSVKVSWGVRPFRHREVFTPWDDAPVLPGWCAEISLESGLEDVCTGHSAIGISKEP